jgi:hypothetical protein
MESFVTDIKQIKVGDVVKANKSAIVEAPNPMYSGRAEMSDFKGVVSHIAFEDTEWVVTIKLHEPLRYISNAYMSMDAHGRATYGSNHYVLIKIGPQMNSSELKAYNSNPQNNVCGACGGELKNPYINIRYCPVCEK